MTISDILEQAKELSPQERRELVKLLIDLLDAPSDQPDESPSPHWGQRLLRLLDEIGTVEMLYPEIDNPTEWVMRLRAEQRQMRLGDWDETQ